MENRVRSIAVIDLKAFYSYVECVDRGLDPWTTPLVVADKERSVNTIILSVTPFLKSKGIPSRLRIRDLPKGYDYIYAVPRMERYIEMSAKVVDILLDFVSEEDLHVYSIDEAFIDLTTYLPYYQKTPKQIVKDIMSTIKEKTGLQATAGIGDNFFLAKVALDIYAKKQKDGIAIMHKEDVPEKLWPITPLSKVWGIGEKTEKKLNAMGIFNMEQLAKCNPDYIHKKFGIMGDQLIDCANGIDESDIREEYIPKEKSFSIGQTLPKNYSMKEARLIVKELVDDISLRLRNEGKVTGVVMVYVGYASNKGGFGRQMSLLNETDDTEKILEAALDIYDQNITDMPIRRLGIALGKVGIKGEHEQLNLFDDPNESDERRKLQKVTDLAHNKYGPNALLRASSILTYSTAKERHSLIGGHKK